MLIPGCLEGGACSLLGTEGPLHLAGYGVELAIKNMEYSALDDSQVFLPFSSRATCQAASGSAWLQLPYRPPFPLPHTQPPL